MAHRQIHPLDESGVEPSRQAQFLQGSLKSGLCPQAHHMGHPNQLTPSVAFLHLTVDQPRCHLPLAHVAPATTHLEPLTKVGRESIEVQIEPVTREERDAERRPGSLGASG
jgi:hypothetical protein